MSNNIIDLANLLQYQVSDVRVHSNHRLIRVNLGDRSILADLPKLGRHFVSCCQVQLNQLIVEHVLQRREVLSPYNVAEES